MKDRRRRGTPDTDVGRFERWGAAYDRSLFQPALFRPVHRAVLGILSPAEGERILEVGCGTGTLALQIAEATAAQTIGADPAVAMVRAAAGKSPDAGVHFTAALAEALPFGDDAFDAATTSISVHHWSSARAGLAEMGRVVRPGGRVVIADLQELGPVLTGLRAIGRVSRHHHHGWAATDLGDLLHRAGFEDVRARTMKTMGAAVVILAAARPNPGADA